MNSSPNRLDFELSPALFAGSDTVHAFQAWAEAPQEMRHLTMRATLFCSILHLTSEKLRPSTLKALDITLDMAERLEGALARHIVDDAFHADALGWAQKITQPLLTHRRVVSDGIAMIRDYRKDIEAGAAIDTARFEQLLAFGGRDFRIAAMALYDALRADLDDRNATAMAQRERATARAEDATDRISKISKTVRMIAINATVEASRAGEAGRRFSLIAGEIKNLSEASDKAVDEICESLNEVVATMR